MNQKLGKALARRLNAVQDYERMEVNVFLKGEPAQERLLAIDAHVESVASKTTVNMIQDQCSTIQRNLIGYLQDNQRESAFIDDEISMPQAASIKSYWINNSVSAEVSRKTLEQILKRPDVEHVELVRQVNLEDLLDSKNKVTDDPGKRVKSKLKTRRPIDAVKPIPTWSVKRINAPLLWQKGINGDGVLVAVIDTGVNYKHPDLKDHMWDGGTDFPKHGYDYANNDNDPIDEQGHGTSCAGIVAGNGKSGRLTGVAPGARIMAVRVGGAESSFWAGMQFALEYGAQVISMSMSWKFPWDPNYPGWRRICETILAAGVLHANSIGNQGDELEEYPIPYNIATPGNCPPPRLHPLQTTIGGLSSSISCGATDDSDSLANYSGRGPAAWEKSQYVDYPYQDGMKMGLIKPDLCAPGPGTVSCNWKYPGGVPKPYSRFGGTSAATPHVAGCLTLLAQACIRSGNPIMPDRILEALESTTIWINGQSKDKENHFGAGRVDVFAAFNYGQSKGWWD